MLRACLAVLLACLGSLYPPGSVLGGNRTETAHLAVDDVDQQLSPDQLQRFAADAEAALQKAIKFWAISYRTAELGKIRLELHPERAGQSFTVFQFEKRETAHRRVVRVHGIQSPQELVHKLTHALFPTDDKLVRNMMGIPTEERFGNPISFPMCGRNLDAWVMALRRTDSYIALKELGKQHEDWGMTFKGQMPVVSDRKRQHASYLEAGSFGTFLLKSQGVEKIKAFYKASSRDERPWRKAFDNDLPTLENQWLKSLEEYGRANQDEIDSLAKLWQQDPNTACYETQGFHGKTRPSERPRRKSR